MFNKVSVAVAAALFTSSAFALAPGATVHYEIWMSGSSAQDNSIARLFADICVAGTLDTFQDGTIVTPVTVSGKKHQAYFCTVDRTQVSDAGATLGGDGLVLGGTTVNPNVLFHKRSDGGSGQGVGPVISGAAITAMVVSSTNCALTSTANLYACSVDAGTTIEHVSDAGVSDVNPGLYIGANAGIEVPVSPEGLSVIVQKPGVALLFGIPVSEPLYRALQWVQGKIPTAATIDESEAAMPSLSKAEVASIMGGKVKNWNAFKAGPAGQGLRDYAVTLGALAPASNLVNICRRVNGSGAQAQMSAKFLHYPCTPGALAPVATSSSFTGPVVFSNASSDNVDACLDTAATANKWAIGVQSMEKNFLVGGAYPLQYRFVKIDGFAPTLANAANGKYFDWVENSYQWRQVSVTNSVGTVVPPLTGDELDIVFTIANNAGKTDIVRDVLNSNLVYSFGQSGYLALDTNGTNAPGYPFVSTNPVMPYTHTHPTGLDNCRVPVLLDSAGM